MFWEITRYLIQGRFYHLWIEPDFHFKYYGFSWIQPIPETGMYFLAGIMLLAAAFFTIDYQHSHSHVESLTYSFWNRRSS